MSRPRRKPRPPGNVRVVCTGRGKHDPVRFKPPLQLQLAAGEHPIRITWDSRMEIAPVTSFHAADGPNTFEFTCGSCGRHWKRHEDEFIIVAFALADHQGITGDDSTPITMDISHIENA